MTLTNNDRTLGPITIGRLDGWRPLRLCLSSGCDEYPGCRFSFYLLGWAMSLSLPQIIRPHRVKVDAKTWDAATIERLGRDWYYDVSENEYGFCLTEGHFTLYLGAQTMDSSTTKDWSCFLPWTQWRFVRFSLYDEKGQHFWTQLQKDRRRGDGFSGFEEQRKHEYACPTVCFRFTDYDGKPIVATTQIHEREWHFGEGWFKWLSLFRRPKIIRSLDLKFDAEVGPEKGSWKGGTVGHGIDMLPGELHEEAFRRYCDLEKNQRGRSYRIAYVEKLEPSNEEE